MNHKLPVGFLIGLTFLLLLLLTQGHAALGSQGGGQAPDGTPLSLPLVLKGQGSAPASPTTVPANTPTSTSTVPPSSPTPTSTVPVEASATAQPTPGTSSRLFLPYEFDAEVHNTSNPTIAVDAAGGVHVAYEPFAWGLATPEPVYYAYCAANCNTQGSFTAIALHAGDSTASYVNLALGPAGRPRLLWQVFGGFRYAECNALPCTSPANWSISAQVIGRLDGLTDGSNRMLALDSLGRPRFVFNDRSSDDHFGTYYMACNAACTNAANWEEVLVLENQFRAPSLALTSDDLPRFAFRVDVGEGTRFGYIECNSACEDPAQANWGGVLIYYIDVSYSSYSLRLDSDGRPRAALYTGPVASSTLEANQSYYVWCDASCGEAGNAQWQATQLYLSGDGYKNLSFALDAQDRPRIGYNGDGGMWYLSCDGACNGSGTWQDNLVESAAALDESDLVESPPGCQFPGWSLGYHVSLALDPSGNPRMVYDARHLCYPGTSPQTNVAWARFASFNQP